MSSLQAMILVDRLVKITGWVAMYVSCASITVDTRVSHVGQSYHWSQTHSG